jgi:hypothetical protein
MQDHKLRTNILQNNLKHDKQYIRIKNTILISE